MEMLNSATLPECFDVHEPLRRIQVRNVSPPWITAELKEAMRGRDECDVEEEMILLLTLAEVWVVTRNINGFNDSSIGIILRH
ncbi:hypothetical protein G5I_01868 [Acromyrmex echinatior]|uniref:Uncharacterized protein n=1 Tax=Acromyrmex echinatior TaxID=103372 RepID=F4W8T1_ACREC|nr:hypothetical protein G5I_01868 [Acromyrmex echinatior]